MQRTAPQYYIYMQTIMTISLVTMCSYLAPSTLSKFSSWVGGSWILCQTKPALPNWQLNIGTISCHHYVCIISHQFVPWLDVLKVPHWKHISTPLHQQIRKIQVRPVLPMTWDMSTWCLEHPTELQLSCQTVSWREWSLHQSIQTLLGVVRVAVLLVDCGGFKPRHWPNHE